MFLKAQSSFVTGPAGQLEYRIKQPDPSSKQVQAWVVLSHPHPQFGGTMNNKVIHTLEKSFQSLGYGTLAFNFRGVEQSEGEYDGGEGEQQDLAFLVNWLRHNQPVEKLILAGFSFGSFVTLKQHQVLRADGLCLVAPPVNLYDFSGLVLANKPSTIIMGEQDEVVPADEVWDWCVLQKKLPENAQKMNLYWRAEAGHFFHRQLVWLKQTILMSY